MIPNDQQFPLQRKQQFPVQPKPNGQPWVPTTRGTTIGPSFSKPKPDALTNFLGNVLAWGILLALLGWAVSSWGGPVVGSVLLICFTFPVIPLVIAVFLLICLVLWLWERDQRSIIRSELEKFHNKR